MKITILDTIPGEEDEIIIKCQNLSEDIQNLLQKCMDPNYLNSIIEIKTGKHQDRRI